MTADVPQTTPERADLIVGCIGVAALEICKIPDPKRRAQVARNAARVLREIVSNGNAT